MLKLLNKLCWWLAVKTTPDELSGELTNVSVLTEIDTLKTRVETHDRLIDIIRTNIDELRTEDMGIRGVVNGVLTTSGAFDPVINHLIDRVRILESTVSAMQPSRTIASDITAQAQSRTDTGLSSGANANVYTPLLSEGSIRRLAQELSRDNRRETGEPDNVITLRDTDNAAINRDMQMRMYDPNRPNPVFGNNNDSLISAPVTPSPYLRLLGAIETRSDEGVRASAPAAEAPHTTVIRPQQPVQERPESNINNRNLEPNI